MPACTRKIVAGIADKADAMEQSKGTVPCLASGGPAHLLGLELKRELDQAGSPCTALPPDKYPAAKGTVYLLAKRFFDISFSLGVLIALFLPCLIVALLVWRDTKANPLYSQERMTYHGRKFRILKFRSMVPDSDNVEKHLSAAQYLLWKQERKIPDDPRVTKLGRILRSTNLDEIPQFVNVLLGDMSVVGPRPISEEELEWFGSNKGILLSMRAGMTGLWQTSSGGTATFLAGKRQGLELEYVNRASFLLDMEIIVKTIGLVFSRTRKTLP